MPIADAGPGAADGQNQSDVLEAVGPTLAVDIGFDPSFHGGAGTAIPPQTVPALVDTGASESCIDDQLAQQLGLPAIDRQQISGVGGLHSVTIYLAQVHFPPLNFTQTGRFSGVDLSGGGQAHRALIGRTFLRNLIMIYDGLRGQVTLAR